MTRKVRDPGESGFPFNLTGNKVNNFYGGAGRSDQFAFNAINRNFVIEGRGLLGFDSLDVAQAVNDNVQMAYAAA